MTRWLWLALAGCAEPTELCHEYVECAEARDAVLGVSSDYLAPYEPGGSCWHTGSTAADCTQECIDELKIIREGFTPLPRVCNPAPGEPASPYDPLPAAEPCSAPRVIETGTVGASDLAIGDLDGDLDADLVVADGEGAVRVFTNDGTGRFAALGYVAARGARDLHLGDVTGDGVVDILLLGRNFDTLVILVGQGDGTFVDGGFPSVVGDAATYADFDGDGALDAFVTTTAANGMAWLVRGNGDGTFQPAMTVSLGVGVGQPRAVDFDGDGDTDVLVARADGVALGLARNDGSGGFAFEAVAGVPLAVARPFEPADLDGDGRTDVALGGLEVIDANAPWRLGVGWGDGDGGLVATDLYPAPEGTVALRATDLDEDGNVDLVYTAPGGLYLRRGLGDRAFAEPIVRLGLDVPSLVAVGDLDRDGAVDVAVVTGFNDTRRQAITFLFACRGD